MDVMGNKTIAKARVTYVFNGYGDLTLTDEGLIWNKSATSFLAFGALNTLTTNHVTIPLSGISGVGTYTYFPGGGLLVTTKAGMEHKFSFKRKKDFKVIYDYLTNAL